MPNPKYKYYHIYICDKNDLQQNRFVDFHILFKVEIEDLKIDKPNLKNQSDITAVTIPDVASRIVRYEEIIFVQMGQKVSETKS